MNHAKPCRCWETAEKPSAELMQKIHAGSLAAAAKKGPAEFEKALARYRRETVSKPVIYIGTGTCGLGAGAKKTLEAIRTYLKDGNVDADVVEVGCIGMCSEEPMVDVQLPGRTRVCYRGVTADKVTELLKGALKGVPPAGLLMGQFRDPSAKPYDGVTFLDEHPFFSQQIRLVLANCGFLDPDHIEEYIARGGYSQLARILRGMSPADVRDTVEKSGLRGRGGAGFPTGKKWQIAAASKGDQKYLICNADEGDPGAFMDRAVIEGDPYRLLEGMAIAAYAIGASKAYVYIRAEYPLAVKRLKRAFAVAEEYGVLGDKILGSDFSLHISLKMGAGAFVCGEETALIQSVEGKRGMPKLRPPYPAVEGAFGKPTIINNVETLAGVPEVMRLGHEVFSSIGTTGSKGTKVFALSGMVNRTGLVEVPMGTTVRQIVMEIGGGIPGRRKPKGVQMGGPSGGCIPEPHFDVEVDYESLKTLGAIMGSGGMVVMDEGTCMVDLAKFFMEFIQRESCGKCIPCREGTAQMLKVLEAITQNRKGEENLDALLRFQGVMYLEQLANTIKDVSLCGLGQTAPNPVLSTLRWFRDEYEAHVFERRCPAGVCKELVGAPCETACPVGTEVWRYVAHIARGEHEEAYRVIRDANVFPSVCARVCNHPCEAKCRCGTTGGEPIAVRSLKRFVVDHVDPASYKVDVKKAGPGAAKVAIVGGGPSGITAAHYLSAAGHRVTIFEKEKKLGGMLVSAIPAYRLPREVLQKEIDSLLNENVQVRTETAMGKDFTVDKLFKDGYKAVYLAIGSHESQKLGIPGEDTAGVYPAMQFLKGYNLHGKELAKGKVGIIGGGNSAIDSARVAFRQKGVESVTVFYRRTHAEMPAYQEEIEAALEEGIKIVPLVAPVAAHAKGGKLHHVTLQKNKLGERDASGRAKPVPIPGSEYDVEVDTLIAAIGEQPSSKEAPEMNWSKKSTLMIDPETLATGREFVFGGGDVVTGPNTVIDAVAAGKKAAVMIDRALKGKGLRITQDVKLPSVYVEPVEVGEDVGLGGRAHAPLLSAKKRKGGFAEVELCLSAGDAQREATRCLRCDLTFTQPDEGGR